MAEQNKKNPISDNPFPGLRPFGIEESHLFFGREHQVEELLRKLSSYHFVSVVGTSGSGKSSLVRAGLLARLYEGFNTGTSSTWGIAVMRPGANPILNLARALYTPEVFGEPASEAQIAEAVINLSESALGLVQMIRTHVLRGQNTLILVDQFEELFRFAAETDIEAQKHAAHFVNLLIQAVRQHDAGIYVVITLRADFIGDCAAFEGLPEAINDGQYLIPRLNRDHYKLVIEGPVNHVHGKIAPRLVQQLLNDMSNNQDQLPILQHALMRTWEHWAKNNNAGDPIDFDDYKAVGTMAKALNIHANEAFEELNTRQKKLAEHIFKCITVKENDNRGIRRPTRLQDICEITKATKEQEVIEVLDVFRKSGRGFIMPPGGTELKPWMMVDISHESLMRNWKRLEDWVEQEYESADMYQRLSNSAILHQNGVAGLWRDPELSLALEWKGHNHPHEAWARQYNDDFAKTMHFLDDSKAEKDRMLAEKKNRRTLTNVFIGLFLFFAAGLSLWAMLERTHSAKSEKEALKLQALAEQSEKKAVEKQGEAEKNFAVGEEQRLKAEEQTTKAEAQRLEALKQKRLADLQTEKTRTQKNIAEQATARAMTAQMNAEKEKGDAIAQKKVADSLKQIALSKENVATQMALSALSKQLAMKSLNDDRSNEDKNLKALLALEAYKLNTSDKNDSFNTDILAALYEADKANGDLDEKTLNTHDGEVKGLALSPDGRYLASASGEGKVMLWDMETAKPLPGELPGAKGSVGTVVFSDDGKWIGASIGNDVYVWSTGSPASKPMVFSGHTAKVGAIAISGNTVASGGLDNMLILNGLYDNSIKKIALPAKILSMAYCSTKNLFAAGCDDGGIYLIDKGGLGDGPDLLVKSAYAVDALSFNSSGHVIAAAYADGSLDIYYTGRRNAPLANRLAKGKSALATTLAGHKSAFSALSFGKGYLLASVGHDGKVRLWQWARHYQPFVFNDPSADATSIAISPDGKKLYTGGKDNTITVYNIDQQDIVDRLRKRVTSNFSLEQWNDYVGNNLKYEKVVEELP